MIAVGATEQYEESLEEHQYASTFNRSDLKYYRDRVRHYGLERDRAILALKSCCAGAGYGAEGVWYFSTDRHPCGGEGQKRAHKRAVAEMESLKREYRKREAQERKVREREACFRSVSKTCILAQARATAQEITHERERASVLAQIAELETKLGAKAVMPDDALATVPAITHEGERALTPEQVARTQAEAGMFDEALATARGIRDDAKRTSALLLIARAQADATLIYDALTTAQEINDSRVRALTYAEIAVRWF
jgi:hypothetical protein